MPEKPNSESHSYKLPGERMLLGHSIAPPGYMQGLYDQLKHQVDLLPLQDRCGCGRGGC